ncbi:MAG TPA: polyprenyl synthetase family protein [Planctomycetota bacterium]
MTADTRRFAAWLEHVRPEIEDALCLAAATTSLSGAPAALREAMEHALLAGGKRVRPALALLACEAHGGARAAAMPAALACEAIHAYSLVHDDLPCMDDDSLRRGLPTVHVAHGEALAVLAGDGLQALAFELLAGQQDAELARDQARLLARAAGPAGMVGGQALDLGAEGRPCSAADVERVHAAKTAALLAAALHLGARAAGTEVAPHNRPGSAWDRYGTALGMLFQATDDLLDALASTAALGKTAGKDAAAEKATILRAVGLDAAHEHAAGLSAAARAALDEVPLRARADELRELPTFLLDRVS